MQGRRICQSDIIKYINEELGIPYSSLCTVIDTVRPGNMVEPRISEIKRGKRKGYFLIHDLQSKMKSLDFKG